MSESNSTDPKPLEEESSRKEDEAKADDEELDALLDGIQLFILKSTDE